MIGTTLSHYRITGKLGQGGMGEVYLADDTELGRKVALKFLPDSLEHDEVARKRFLREARSAAAIDHPYSCKIYEIGEAGDKTFIAMEYVEGETLAEMLGNGPLARPTAIRYACEIAEALEKAHEKGIVHRDLKPANVMITVDDHVKVTDFGLAKPVMPEREADGQEVTLTALTQLGFIMGTPAYMSPEQIRGEEADLRSDIFSFGILLYECLTATSPFGRDTFADTTAAVLTAEVPSLAGPNRTAGLQKTIEHAVAKDPHDRFASMREVLAELRSEASPTESEERSQSLEHWKRLGLLALAVLSIGILAFLGWSFLDRREGPERTDVASLQVADHTSRARSLMQNFSDPQDLSLALEAWQKVLELRPDDATALAGLATTRALIAWNSSPEPDQLKMAEQEASQAIEIDPQLADSYLALSVVYQLEGLLDTAVEMSNRSIELAPEDPWVLQARARFLMDRFGDSETAEEIARRATEIDPRHYPAWFQLGWAQFELEKSEAAESSFRQAISLQPDFGAGYLGLGMVLLGSGRYEEAVQSLDKAVQIDPHALLARYFLGVAHHYLGDSQKALADFSLMVEDNPDHPLAAWGHLGQAVEYQALGEPQKEAEALSKAERQFKSIPGLWISMKGLAGVAALRGQTQRALDWLQQARLAGLHSVHQLTMEPALDSLADNPEFLGIIDEIRRSRGPEAAD